MVDCGYAYDAARAAIAATWEQVLGGRPITRLIVTHFQSRPCRQFRLDRAALGRAAADDAGEWFAASIALRDNFGDGVARRVAFFREHGLDEARLATFAQGTLPYSTGVELPPAYRRIADGDDFTIGGDSWTVLTGEGHSPEHAALYCAARKLLISGDQILPTITTNISVWPTEPRPIRWGFSSPPAVASPRGSIPRPWCCRRTAARSAMSIAASTRWHSTMTSGWSSSSARPTARPPPRHSSSCCCQRALDGHQMGFAMARPSRT